MNKIVNYNGEKATVCAENTCVTVYGEAAKFVTAVAVCTVGVIAIALVAKALR